jgi:hypothetical protein
VESLNDIGNSDAKRHSCFLVLLWNEMVADVKLGWLHRRSRHQTGDIMTCHRHT